MLPTVGPLEVLPEITVTEPLAELVELASIEPVLTDTGAPIKMLPAGPLVLVVTTCPSINAAEVGPMIAIFPEPPLPLLTVDISPKLMEDPLVKLMETLEVEFELFVPPTRMVELAAKFTFA